jgi:mono/diheme cytochrome c family protein
MSKSIRMRIALAVVLVALHTAAPLASAQIPLKERGLEVFRYWCAPCHSAGAGNPGTVALEVRYQGSKPAPLEERTDLAPELTKLFVRNGISIMAPFRKTEITDADLEALAAYLAPDE